MRRVLRIDHNAAGEGLVLLDDTDTVLATHESPFFLSDLAFDQLGATDVRHDYDLVSADSRFQKLKGEK